MNRNLIGCSLVLAVLCGWPALRPATAAADAASFAQVEDVNALPQPTDGMEGEALFVPAGNKVFLSAYTRENGKELWRTDGTEAGTSLIKDINPGEESSIGYYGSDGLALGNLLLFNADDGAVGDELWVSDGTPAGTKLLKDLWPGADSGLPYGYITYGSRAYFSAQISETQRALWITDGTTVTMLKVFSNIGSFRLVGGTLFFSAAETGSNAELWKSDGTPAGTVLVKDIYPGQQGSSPNYLIELSPGLLVFSADDGTHGPEMWRSDGTPAGTALIYDIRPGSTGSDPDNMIVREAYYGLPPTYYNLLFAANDGVSGREFWQTDGFNTTQLAKDAYPGASSSDPYVLASNYCNYKVYSSSCPMLSLAEPTYGRELWVADGVQGIVLLKDIYPGNGWSSPSPMVKAGNAFFFSATTPTAGVELWRSDGTPSGTVQLADIKPGAQSGYPGEMVAFDGGLYFGADDGTRGRELWKSDGTPAGTTLLKDIGPDDGTGLRRLLGTALGALYFAASDGASGSELWKTDGTTQGTVRVKNIAPDVGGLSIYNDYNAAALGERLVFGLEPSTAGGPVTMTDVTAGGSLWVSDGTAAGTAAIKSFPAVEYRSDPYGLTTLGDGVLFGAIDNVDVYELWRSDGSANGTAMLKNVVKPYFGQVDNLTRLNDQVIFSTRTAMTRNAMSTTHAIWKTDGTPQGTQQVKGDVIYGYGDYAASGSSIFFAGSTPDDEGNRELWKTDGTAAGTVLVKEISSGNPSSSPDLITPGTPGSVYFVADVGASGFILWKSDGTAGGTMMVADVRPSDDKYEYGELAYVGNTLFFTANDGSRGWELWKSDGTAGGTVMVADLYPGQGSSSPEGLVGMNGSLFFSATGSDGKRTLWRSDGSVAGTQPVRVGAGTPLNPDWLTVAHGRLMFSAADEHGREAWSSDGTAAGTALLQDIRPGAESSNPQSFIAAGQRTFITADTPGIGRELWVMSPQVAPPSGPGVRRLFLPGAQR